MQRWAHGHCRVRLAPRSLIGGIGAEETVVFCEGSANPCCNPPQNVPDMCPFGEQASALLLNLQKILQIWKKGLKMLGTSYSTID